VIQVSAELLQLLGFFLGLGVLYGGVRSDLKRLHVQAEQMAIVMRKTRRRLSGHIKREESFCGELMTVASARRRSDGGRGGGGNDGVDR